MANGGGRGTLRVGVPYTPTGIDPHVNSSELAYKLFSNLVDPLLERTDDGQFVGGLASTWDVLAAGSAYRFELRDGVAFHDGTPCDAAAVKASLDRVVDPATRSQAARDMLGPYVETIVHGRLELEVRLAEPYAPFLDAMSQAWLAPVSPRSFDNRGAEPVRLPIGSGPFRAVEWPVGGELVLERNPDYDGVLARLEAASFAFLTSPAEQLDALRQGSVDAIYEFPPTQMADIGDGVQVDVVPVPGAPVSLMMNVARPPTDDLRIRQGIVDALDVPELVRRVFGGVMPVASAPLSRNTWGYVPPAVGRSGPDSARAAELLAPARGVTLTFYAIPHASYPAIGAEIGRQLHPFGIDVDVRVVTIGEWLAAGNSGAHHLITVGKFTTEADVLEVLFHSRHNGHGYAWTWSQDEVLDALLARAVRSIDADQRAALFRSIQHRIAEQALSVPLHENTNVTLRRPAVHGLHYDLRGYPVIRDVSVDR